MEKYSPPSLCFTTDEKAEWKNLQSSDSQFSVEILLFNPEYFCRKNIKSRTEYPITVRVSRSDSEACREGEFNISMMETPGHKH